MPIFPVTTQLRSAIARAPFVLLLTVYVVLYGGLLWATDFLPYVMDNNETFSSLWHAANLFNYGVSQSWGLADEAFSPHPEAHPYVHTHQGNFPRLFALAIYALGARSAESQIAITTFTIGLAAIGLIYSFFARIATPWFAFTVCLVFMTDYLLFAQWHVVTYRVWHSFLLFACLLTVHRATESGDRRWWWLIAAAFACLFYFELVFAAFVGAFSFLYAATRPFALPRRLFMIMFAQAAGATAALTIVIAQVIGYLGPQDFWRDIYLTFLARNDYSTVPGLLDEAGRFYESRHIIFWYNVEDRERFAGMLAFVRSFTAFDWRVHTPLLSLAVWIVCFGWLLSVLPRGNAVMSSSRYRVPAGYLAFFLGVWLFVGSIFLGPDWAELLLGLLTAGAVTALARFILGEIRRQGTDPAWQDDALVLLVTGAVFGAAGLLVQWHEMLFDQTYRQLWEELQGKIGPSRMAGLVLISAALVASSLATAGARRVIGDSERGQLCQVATYLVCGATAYAIVYALSPGYIYSGYLNRHAPFTVFLTDVVMATAIYVSIKAAVHSVRFINIPMAGVDQRSLFLIYVRASLAAVTTSLALFLTVFWAVVQTSYVRWLPPNHYSFLKTLSEPPFRGASFVVDNYAAPVAAYTGGWAYYDPTVSLAQLVQIGDKTRLVGNRRYLWLADRATNDEYRRPQYYVCMVPQSPKTAQFMILRHKGRAWAYLGCSSQNIVRLGRNRNDRSPSIEVVASDSDGQLRKGFESWAIVKLRSGDTAKSGIELDWIRDPLSRQ